MGEHRFYLSPEHWASPSGIVLDGQEARHMTQALRLRAGDRVALLDGQGRAGQCRILRIDKTQVLLDLQEERFVPRPPSLPVVALAFSKAVRRGFFAEKAAELGAHAVWLWQGDFSQGKLQPRAADAWRAQMIAGIKQSGNPWLPDVRVLAGGVEELTQRAARADRRILPWELEASSSIIPPSRLGLPGVTVYAIGPEGGFSPRELAALDTAGFARISLGGRILRCETAATLCLGLHWWASQLPDHSPRPLP